MILATKTYYETVKRADDNPKDGIDYKGILVAHDSLEEAIEYAEENGITTIQEIGGCWTEYEKCWFCEKWFDTNELNTNNECSRCELAIKDHFGYQNYGTDGRRIS